MTIHSTPTTKRSNPMTTVGLDIGDKYIHLHELTPFGEVLEQARFKNDPKKLELFFKDRDPCRIVLEVGSQSRWITLQLRSYGHDVLMADPRQLKLISGSLFKNDKRDAEMLALLGTQTAHLIKTVEVREDKHQHALTMVRARAAAVEARTKLVNTIRGLLKPYAEKIPKEGRSRAFVEHARENVEQEFAIMLEPLLQSVEQLNKSVHSYDDMAEKMLPEVAPDAQNLLTIHGVGVLTVLYFAALIGDPNRFSKSRNVGAYLGLTRSQADSGETVSDRGISHAGDAYMRALLANCASYILGPFGKDSDLRRWGLAKITQISGGAPPKSKKARIAKKKVKVALARKLSVLMLTLWKTGHDYDPDHHSKRQAPKQAA